MKTQIQRLTAHTACKTKSFVARVFKGYFSRSLPDITWPQTGLLLRAMWGMVLSSWNHFLLDLCSLFVFHWCTFNLSCLPSLADKIDRSSSALSQNDELSERDSEHFHGPTLRILSSAFEFWGNCSENIKLGQWLSSCRRLLSRNVRRPSPVANMQGHPGRVSTLEWRSWSTSGLVRLARQFWLSQRKNGRKTALVNKSLGPLSWLLSRQIGCAVPPCFGLIWDKRRLCVFAPKFGHRQSSVLRWNSFETSLSPNLSMLTFIFSKNGSLPPWERRGGGRLDFCDKIIRGERTFPLPGGACLVRSTILCINLVVADLDVKEMFL